MSFEIREQCKTEKRFILSIDNYCGTRIESHCIDEVSTTSHESARDNAKND